METSPQDRRRMPRFEMQLPVEIRRGNRGSAMAVTRDVSAGGIYFYIEPGEIDGSVVEFIVTFPPQITLAKSLKVRCTGRIVRTDRTDSGGLGIATEIQRYEFLNSAVM